MEQKVLDDYKMQPDWKKKIFQKMDQSRKLYAIIQKNIKQIEQDDDVNASVRLIENFIKSMNADNELFAYYVDMLKDSYDTLCQYGKQIALTYNTMKEIESDKNRHNNLYNELQDLRFHIKERVDVMEKKFHLVLTSDNEDFAESVGVDFSKEISELVNLRDFVHQFCNNDIIAYVNKTKKRIVDCVNEIRQEQFAKNKEKEFLN